MVTSEAQEIKKQEVLVRFSIISYKTRLRVFTEIRQILVKFIFFLDTDKFVLSFLLISDKNQLYQI